MRAGHQNGPPGHSRPHYFRGRESHYRALRPEIVQVIIFRAANYRPYRSAWNPNSFSGRYLLQSRNMSRASIYILHFYEWRAQHRHRCKRLQILRTTDGRIQEKHQHRFGKLVWSRTSRNGVWIMKRKLAHTRRLRLSSTCVAVTYRITPPCETSFPRAAARTIITGGSSGTRSGRDIQATT